MINFFKKSLFVALAATMTLSFAQAQESDFDPYWSIGVQGGIAHTVGEFSFSEMISPAAAISGTYRFTPVWGLRGGFSGWQAKGNVVRLDETYKFNFVQLNFDAMVDVMNIFCDYKSDRLVNPYVFAGVGANVAFNNDEAVGYYNQGYMLENVWDGSKMFVAGRAGVGVDFNIIHWMSVGLEANVNMLSDKFNSKDGGNPDWQYNMLAGVSFHIGKKKTTADEPKEKPVKEPKAKPVKEEPKAEPAPAPKPAPKPEQPKAEPKPEPKPAPAPKAEPTKVADPNLGKEYSSFFELNSAEVNSSSSATLTEVATVAKNNPDAKVYVTGYADAETGTSTYNRELSKRRAENVKSALVSKGVASNRIITDYKGGSVQPYSENDKNRTVITVVK